MWSGNKNPHYLWCTNTLQRRTEPQNAAGACQERMNGGVTRDPSMEWRTHTRHGQTKGRRRNLGKILGFVHDDKVTTSHCCKINVDIISTWEMVSRVTWRKHLKFHKNPDDRPAGPQSPIDAMQACLLAITSQFLQTQNSLSWCC